jgi:hypothetical protein
MRFTTSGLLISVGQCPIDSDSQAKGVIFMKFLRRAICSTFQGQVKYYGKVAHNRERPSANLFSLRVSHLKTVAVDLKRETGLQHATSSLKLGLEES